LIFAGVADTWRNRDELLTSCAIITPAANDIVAELHDRMAAILSPDDSEAWLDRKTHRTDLLRSSYPIETRKRKGILLLVARTHPILTPPNCWIGLTQKWVRHSVCF